MEQAIDKTMVTRAIVSKIQEENNPKSIQSKHLIGYDSPNEVTIEGNNEGYTPDLAAIYNSSTTVYEIELDNTMSFEKWRQLSFYAQKNNGDFYLVVPDYLMESIKDKIEDKGINAGLIYFKTG